MNPLEVSREGLAQRLTLGGVCTRKMTTPGRVSTRNIPDPSRVCRGTLAPTVRGVSPRDLQENLLRSNEKQFRGGLVFKARRLLYHSTLSRG